MPPRPNRIDELCKRLLDETDLEKAIELVKDLRLELLIVCQIEKNPGLIMPAPN
jgi:hypothetical protein